MLMRVHSNFVLRVYRIPLKRQRAPAVLQVISIPSTAALVAVHAVMWFRPVEVSLG